MSFLAKLVVLLGLICVGISQTIMDLVDATPTLSTLKSLLEATGLNNTLSQPGTYTVFAPTDDAFDAVTNLGDIVDRFGGAANILLYHVLGSVVTSEDLSPGLIANTLFDGAIVTALVDENITAIVDITGGVSNVEMADVEATNGIVHIMDSVLVPGTIAEYAISNPAVSTLVTALVAADLVDVLNATNTNFTVLAPINDAFNGVNQAVLGNAVAGGNPTFLSNLLTTHVIDVGAPVLSNELTDGQEIPTLSTATVTATVNGTGVYFLNNMYQYYTSGQVVIADIVVVGGVIHVINSVLRFEPDDVVDIVANDPDLTTLTSLVVEYNLVDTLKGAANFTVFAPSDEAFAAISTVLPNLIDSQVSATLQYHVLPIEALSSDITTNLSVSSVNGLPLIVGPQDATVFIQAVASFALVTMADLTSGNGVVHKVDTVLLPYGSITSVVADEADLSTLSAALGVTDFGAAFEDLSNVFTLLGPNDDAFAALLAFLGLTPQELLNNTALLNDVLPYHALANRADAVNLTYGEALETVSGGQLIVNIDPDTSDNSMVGTISFIDDQGNFNEVVEADVQSLNGPIHKLSSVLLPNSTLTSPGSIVNALYRFDDLSTLRTAVILTELLRTLGTTTPLTVLAPVNSGFDVLGTTLDILLDNTTLLTQVLQYHVIAGNITAGMLENGQEVETLLGQTLTVFINDTVVQFEDNIGKRATVLIPDLILTNGIVHVIDTVLEFELGTVFDLISDNPELSTLAGLIVTAGLNGTLSGEGEFTVFAPTNDAFTTLSQTNPDVFALLTNPDDTSALVDALLYHVLGEIRLSTSLNNGDRLNTLFGSPEFYQFISVTNDENGVSLGESFIPPRGFIINVTTVDLRSLNGFVHIIDTVLVPNLLDIPASLPVLGLTTLETALNITNLTSALTNVAEETRFTLFGPTNDALDAVDATSLSIGNLTEVLLLHVVSEAIIIGELSDDRTSYTTLNNGTITLFIGDDDPLVIGGSSNRTSFDTIDVQTTTGMIQVINGVFLPGLGPVTTILEILGFTELVKYLDLTALSETVDSGEFTIFAPSNEAFFAINDTLNTLDGDIETLTEILLYHVVQGKILSTDLSDGLEATTVQGSIITVSINETGSISIIDGQGNPSLVFLADEESSNGIIHGIDSVLFLPTPAPAEEDDDSGLQGWQWALIIVAIVVVVGIVGYVVANQCGLCKRKGGDAQPLLDGTEQ